MVAFLDERLTGLRVFEWGSGGSTLWFAQHHNLVVSIEHDEEWYMRVDRALTAAPEIDRSTMLCHIPLGPAYWSAIQNSANDFILIDGRHRKACAGQVKLLADPPSAILWDDAQRDWYQCSMHFDGYQHRDFADTEHPRTSRLFVRTNGPLAHWLAP